VFQVVLQDRCKCTLVVKFGWNTERNGNIFEEKKPGRKN
jgi:hypothetical protein